MLERIEWLEYSVCRMLAGKSAPTPFEWGISGNTLSEDVEMLKQTAMLISLRPDAARPDPTFVARLRERMLAEVAVEE